MAKFVKEVLREGEYLVATAAGTRKKRKFTPSDISRYANTSTEMLAAGLRIPAPRQHTLDAKPELQENDPNVGYENLGFWEKFYEGVTEDGRVALYGVLDAPGDRNDKNSPAGKVATVIKDVSICTHSFEDGLGNKWDDALWHVALPTHPIEPGQKNFTPLPDDYEVVMMSQMVPMMDIGKLLTALMKCGISLPSDTSVDNLLDRLFVAVTQKSEGSDSDSLNKKPSGTKVETYPIMMSLTQQQVDAIIASNVVNPATGKPFDSAAFADDGSVFEVEKFKKSVTLMSNLLNKSYKERYSDRVKALIASGRVNSDYAQSKLYPMIESLDVKEVVQMSLGSDDGSLPANAVDVTLSALEALEVVAPQNDDSNSSLWMSQRPAAGQTQPKPDQVADLTDEQSAALIAEILKA
jgi:hypothetical protein